MSNSSNANDDPSNVNDIMGIMEWEALEPESILSRSLTEPAMLMSSLSPAPMERSRSLSFYQEFAERRARWGQQDFSDRDVSVDSTAVDVPLPCSNGSECRFLREGRCSWWHSAEEHARHAPSHEVQEAEKDAFIASVVAFLKASKAVSAANPLLMASIGQSCVRPRHLPQLKVLIEERRDLFGVVTEGLTHHVWLTQAHHGQQQQQQQPPQRARTSACTAGAYYAAVRDYLRDQGAVTGSRGLLLSKLGTEFPKAERPAALVRFGWIALLEQASAATEGAVNFRLKDCHRPGYAAVWTDRGGEEEEEAAMVVRMVGGGGEAWAAAAAEAHVIYLHFHSPVGQADVQKHATFLQASRFVREEVEVFRLQGILVDCFQHGSARFERHEFLGDALLRVGQTKTLMSRHGDLGPGALTELRINAEQATTLAMVFTDLDLQPWTALSPCSTRKAWCKARCDVVEALIGELDERLRDQHIPLSLVMRERMKYVIQTITDLTIHRGFQLKAKAARDALPWRA